MPHSNETLLTEVYARFARGDIPGFLALCDDSIQFKVPAGTPFSGVHTKADFSEWIGKVMEISKGTFGERPVHLIANDEHGVAILEHCLERDGKRIEYRTDHIWQFRNGKLSGWEERPGNQEEFNRAWS
jgi:ketosteroid isomerase-like protein